MPAFAGIFFGSLKREGVQLDIVSLCIMGTYFAPFGVNA